ncbi:MAG: sodium:solute symporter [Flavobacteriales bacterium]|nr:sodium:solute symporter [Flavobacteriales bacterium]
MLIILISYFLLLLLISWYTSRGAGEDAYFLGNKKSPWYAVAFGMIGDSLSGVTFISVPGAVGAQHFSYLQLVFGYFFGYIVITQILLPLYYRLNLTSIYTYLQQRFGEFSEKTGSFFFILSRTLGAAGRLYLAASVIQIFIFDGFGIPFEISVAVIIVLILLYTLRGGIKTLVWTDVFQSSMLLLGVVLSILAISQALNLNFSEMVSKVYNSDYTETFFWDWKEKSFFPKQFIGGMFIAIAMTGLDQNMMQKNLSCPNLKDAQKNIRWFSAVLIFVNLFFLALGALLYLYCSEKGISIPLLENGKPNTDHLFPLLALNHLGLFAAVAFLIGLTAATFSSADSVLTTLTTSVFVDVLHADKNQDLDESKRRRLRHIIHIAFAFILLLVILAFRALNNDAIINTILAIAGYTYGPLLGLFAFGLFTKRNVRDKIVPVVCLIAPIICYVLSSNSAVWFNGYLFGFELLLLNGILTYFGLYMISFKKK